VTDAEMVAAAVEEATAASGWCKVIGDWQEDQVVPAERREKCLRAWEDILSNVPGAHEAGVTVLAGTDGFPCGTVAGGMALLIQAGLPVEAAVGAACWTARAFLGLSSLTDGAPADLLVYDTDPMLDPAVLAHPSRIILRGNVIP
jgi:imidazolonepropionase-like amidohydrolase